MTKNGEQPDVRDDGPTAHRNSKMKKFITNLFAGPYIYIPISATIVWFFGLVILLGTWIADGKPRYRETQASVAFISSVGAAYETLFFIICLSVIILYFSSVCLIRYLRHKGRIPGTVRLKEKIYSWLAIFFCGIGCIGLFILAKWNCWDHKSIHWSGTFCFIIGIAFSSIFQTAEVWCLKKEHPDRKHLKRNGICKMVVVGLAVSLAAAFGDFYSYCGGKPFTDNGSHTLEQCETATSTAAILEWSIAFSLNLYFITLIIDLWPSRRTSVRYIPHDKESLAERGQGKSEGDR
ncbi:uncharacterized protein I303_108201 [Kwoniella dejecticola CBS 10117]|uniref:CWH43-like N-terminal domain-containing protein n=1 Tax=Kwoniella dejecticola CBS 10117 TaxID=1296121 RepID=A0A1A5ZY19_9TREE|nr:uncharacterized protein I303_07473 [Kwoniella dejecticola CBS 10117]OBR82706.1 hypothetical protein I303_07473 [Kwoniella dejecticola CBS 10117]